MNVRTSALLATYLFCAAVPALTYADRPAVSVEVDKIWDAGKHNAFTDLIHFQGKWFCVFREGSAHVSPDGSLRVLASEDGQKWQSVALISSAGLDLRDAKICVTPDNQLMLTGAGVTQSPQEKSHQSFVWLSPDGSQWSKPHAVGDRNYWIWRVTWHKGTAYAVGYKTGLSDRTKEGRVRLYRSEDGKKFETLVDDLGLRSHPNESSLAFLEDGTALCLVRRDGKPENGALLGTARPPYTEWNWKDLGIRIGGPQLLQLPSGEFIVSGRDYPKGAKTKVWSLDLTKPALQELVTLPSGGDTSYPGLVFHDDKLWVSYYSSHEGKTSIYLAQVQLP
ncbi:MAG: exo-alpha-sialidase [Pirellulaceae bacterium]